MPPLNKEIKDACDKVGCRVEFETPDDGFVVVFYRYGTQKLSGTAPKTAQKEERINALLEYCKEPRGRDDEVSWHKTQNHIQNRLPESIIRC